MDISKLDNIIPKTGDLLLLVFEKNLGNNLSLDAAIGIWPCINIQPFNAPIVAIIAPKAITFLE